MFKHRLCQDGCKKFSNVHLDRSTRPCYLATVSKCEKTT